MRQLPLAGLALLLIGGCQHATILPSPAQAIASRRDLWGDAAMRQPGGPSYEFFKKLLPPLRYVDADFHHYPIVLSAPGAAAKSRVISNGSALNALARQPNWKNESGTPVRVLVGNTRESFGEDLGRLDGPKYLDEYLPIVQLAYRDGAGKTYRQELFAAVSPDLAAKGAVLAKFDFPAADRGRIELRFETSDDFCKDDGGTITDSSGRLLASYDKNWVFQKFRSALVSKPQHNVSAAVVIYNRPADVKPSTQSASTHAAMVEEEEAAGEKPRSRPSAAIDRSFYDAQRQACIQRWDGLLKSGATFDVPEPVVNNAWRSLIVAQYAILAGDHLNYSASNQYARMYANETGDSMRSLLLFGHARTARMVLPPLFVYRRPASILHDGAFKLEDLCDYYFQTRDKALIEQMRPLWQAEVDLLLGARQANGLFPRERYCSDIQTPVNSLNNNANAWRGLRDMSIVLGECGDLAQAKKLEKIAAEYKPQILAAMNKAICRNVDPPFVPVAMSGEEPPPNPITSTRLGSYWNLVIPCALWSGIFPIDSDPANFILRYIQENGGLCMGMTRVQSVRGFWLNTQNVDDLYGLRYQLALMKRDEDPDRVLVGFYGKLAQGFTRDTFIDGESSGIVPVDRFGRQLALPPNSTANASFLIQLRYLLVQDWDMNDDGRADTLRLLFDTPRRWLADGQTIRITHAPTAYGKISLAVTARLSSGQIDVAVSLPAHPPPQILLRLRLPDGYRIIRASVAGKRLQCGLDTLDLSGLTGDLNFTVNVAR
jgi:hypothetical protein